MKEALLKTLKMMLKIYVCMAAIGITTILLYPALPISWQKIIISPETSQYMSSVQFIALKMLIGTMTCYVLFTLFLFLHATVIKAINRKPREMWSTVLVYSEFTIATVAAFFIVTSHTVTPYIDKLFNIASR